MATYATFQRRKIKQRRRDNRTPWLLFLLFCVAIGATAGGFAQRWSSLDELPMWIVASLIMGAVAHGVRPYLLGTHHLESSIDAEGWTTIDLRKVLPKTWCVVVGVDFGSHGDVDQIAIGPSGVLVIETKATDSDRITPDIADGWGRQTLDNARRVGQLLKHNYGHEVDVRSAIVVTAMKGTRLPPHGQGVPIIRRGELREAVDSLTKGQPILTNDKVEDIRAALLDYRGQRADYEQAKEEELILTPT